MREREMREEIFGAIVGAIVASLPATSAADPSTDELVEVLAELASFDTERIVAAADRAGKLGHPVFVDPLRGVLLGKDGRARAAAAIALGEIGVPQSSEDLTNVLAALIRATRDTDESVGEAAIAALARFPFPGVRGRLAAISQDSSLSERRRAAARRELLPGKSAEAKARLEAWLEVTRLESESGANSGAPEIRWKIPAEHLVRFARDLLDPDSKRHLDSVSSIFAWPKKNDTVPFLERALVEPDPLTRQKAVAALSAIEGEVAESALVRAVDDGDDRVRQAAIAGLAAKKSPRAALGLSRRLGKEAQSSLLRAGLAAQADPDLFSALEQLPADEAAIAEAIPIVGARGGERGARLLVRWLDWTERVGTRNDIASQLANRSDDDLVPAVVAALAETEEGEAYRLRLLAPLKGRTDPRIAPALLEIVGSGRADRAVLDLLLEQPESSVRPGLIALLSKSDKRARALALEGVEHYRGPDVTNGLVELLEKHPDEDLAFEILVRQQDSDRLPPMIDLLTREGHGERRPVILRALASSRDPRLARSAVKVTLDDPELAPLAIEVLSHQDPPEATRGLSELASTDHLADRQRAHAIRLLAEIAPEHAVEHIRPLANAEPIEVRMAARNTLHDLLPEIFPAWDPYGRAPLVIESAIFGSTMLLVAAQIAEARLSPAFTAGAGAVLGAATPWLLTRQQDVSLGDAGYFGTVALWGTLGGWGAGGALGLSERDTRWATIAGEALGLSVAALTLRDVEWGMGEVTLSNFTAIEAGISAAALSSLAGATDNGYIALLAGGAMTVPMAIFGRKLELRDDLGLVLTAMAHGAWLGAFTPGLINGEPDPVLGAIAGQGFGYLAGLAVAQLADLSATSAIGSVAGAAIGSAIGGGLSLSIESLRTSRAHYGVIQAGSAAGAIALGILAERLELKKNDELLIGLSAIGGAIAGARIESRSESGNFRDASFAGNVLLGAGAGTAAGLFLSQLVDAEGDDLAKALASGALLAAAGAGFARMVPNLAAQDREIITGASFASGLMLGAPFASALDLGASNLGFAAIAGAAGGLFASQLPKYWDSESDNQVGAGVLFGSALFSYGAIAASQMIEIEERDLALVASGVGVGSAIGAGLGMVVPAFSPKGEAALLQGVGLAGLIGATALAASRSGSHGEVDSGTLLGHTALFAAHGAWHGALIPYTWRDGEIPDRERSGGMLLGAGSGAAIGYALARLLDEPLSGGDLLESSILAAAANGLGGAIGRFADDRKSGAILMEGLGVGGLLASTLLAPSTSYQGDAIASFGLTTFTLGWFGGWLPTAIYGDEGSDRSAAGILAGASLGVLAGAAYAQTDIHEEPELFAFAALGSALGAGLSLAQSGDLRRTSILIDSVGLGALASGLLVAPLTTYGRGDHALIGAAAAFGAWHGAFAARLFDSTEDRQLGGALLGSSLGALGGIGLSQFTSVEPLDVLEASLVSGAGSAIGAGLGMALGEGDRFTAAAIELGGLGSLAIASWLASSTEYSKDDLTLIGLSTGFGLAHGAILPSIWGREDDAARTGGALLGAGAGFLAGLGISQVAELDPKDQAETLLFAAAGDAIGGGLSLLGGGRPATETALFLEAGGLAGLASGLAIAGSTTFSSDDRSLMFLGTMMGGWHGAWLGPMIGGEQAEKRSAGGALLGSGLGFLASAAISQASEVALLDQIESVVAWTYGSAIGGGLALSIEGTNDRTGAALLEAGGALGLAGGLLLAPSTEISDGDRGLIALMTSLGAWHGSTLPLLVSDEPEGRSRAGGALIGAGALGLGAHVLSQYTEYDPSDVGEILIGSLIGNGMGLGVGLMIPGADTRLKTALIDGFGVGATLASLFFAPGFALERDRVIDYALFTSLGATLGGFTPALWNGPRLSSVPGEQLSGGLMVGTGLGIAAAATLSGPLHLDDDRREAIAVGALAGAMTGGGLGLAFSEDDRLASGLLEGLMLAGAIGVGATADPLSFDAGSMATGALYVGYLTWHELGFSLLLEGTDRQAAGATMATLGVGALTGIYLVPKLRLRTDQTLMLFAGSVWGSWIGGWGGAILKDGLRDIEGRRSTGLVLLSTVLGSDLGLALTGLVVGGILDVEPTRFAVINLCGVGGMMVGMLAAGFAKEEPLKAGNVIGSLGGLLAGAIATSFFDFSEKPSPYDEPAAAPAAAKSDGGFPIRIEHWMPSASVQPTENGERYMLGIVGLWD
jgi:HEAT repeat protein